MPASLNKLRVNYTEINLNKLAQTIWHLRQWLTGWGDFLVSNELQVPGMIGFAGDLLLSTSTPAIQKRDRFGTMHSSRFQDRANQAPGQA
jgi:hypothetical protein